MNSLKPVIICFVLLTLQACGGGTNPVGELDNKNQDTNLDITDGNDVTDGNDGNDVTVGGGDTGNNDENSDQGSEHLITVLSDFYKDNGKSMAYVDELVSVTNTPFVAVPASGNFDMNGAFIVYDVGESGEDTALGLLDLSVQIENNKFTGSVYDIVQLNSDLEKITGNISGTLDVAGTANANTMIGTAKGTLTTTSGGAFDANFNMSGDFSKIDDGSISVLGDLQDTNSDLSGNFVAVQN